MLVTIGGRLRAIRASLNASRCTLGERHDIPIVGLVIGNGGSEDRSPTLHCRYLLRPALCPLINAKHAAARYRLPMVEHSINHRFRDAGLAERGCETAAQVVELPAVEAACGDKLIFDLAPGRHGAIAQRRREHQPAAGPPECRVA